MTPSKDESQINTSLPPQRKTTLKWSSNGELSSIDMARILDKLSNAELTQCDLTCNLESSE